MNSEIPYLLVGVDANQNKGLNIEKLTYASPLSCDFSQANWQSDVIFIDANGRPRIRVVEMLEDDMTCNDIGDYGISVCGIYLGNLVMATDGKPALLLLTRV